MNKPDVFIFEGSKNNFDTAVIQNSHKVPVFVEFMGIWSGPCIQMSEELSEFAKEFAGQFIFVKVDTDEQTELMKQYNIKNLPTLNVFINGEVVDEEEGQLNQQELRTCLKKHGIYSQVDELRQRAREKHMAGDTLAAMQLLTQAMQQDASNTKVAMDMGQIFIDVDETEQAKTLYNQLPDSAKSSDMGKSLLGQLTFLDLAANTQGKFQLQQDLLANPNNCDSHFDLAVCLIAEKDYEQASSHLLEVMNINPQYKDDAAREMIINVANMLAPNNQELSSKIRSKLSSKSFS